jgi:hypothetical protein
VTSLDYGRAADLTERLQTRLVDAVADDAGVTRRAVLGGLGIAGGAALAGLGSADDDHGSHGSFGAKGEYADLDFDPHEYLT